MLFLINEHNPDSACHFFRKLSSADKWNLYTVLGNSLCISFFIICPNISFFFFCYGPNHESGYIQNYLKRYFFLSLILYLYICLYLSPCVSLSLSLSLSLSFFLYFICINLCFSSRWKLDYFGNQLSGLVFGTKIGRGQSPFMGLQKLQKVLQHFFLTFITIVIQN